VASGPARTREKSATTIPLNGATAPELFVTPIQEHDTRTLMREGVAAPAGGANVTVTTDQEIERPTTAAPTRPRPQLWRLNVLGPVELCYDGRVVEVPG